MEAAARGQVRKSAAEVYEEFFVPALFAEWAPRVAKAASLTAGQNVLDVACGTGVLAREASEHVGPGGSVAAIDCNPDMLSVAARMSDNIHWKLGQAEALPYADQEFDAVVSQFGLMFFEGRIVALKDMWRVLRPGGRLVIAVWDAVGNVPGYAAMIALLQELFGETVADALRAPYNLGDTNELLALFSQAGIEGARVETQSGAARFPSIASWVHTDVKGWTLADMIDDDQYRTLQQAAGQRLQGFVQQDGTVSFANPAHIVTAQKT